MGLIENSCVLITGGTGSFGRALCSELLATHNPRRVVIFSRDEMKQWEMAQAFGHDPRLRFFIGDVREEGRLRRAFHQVDFVFHAAANKIVPTAEYNPFEVVNTNIRGAMNVVGAALDSGVKRVVALSTDKASSPINLYGATKLVSDKLFTASNVYSGTRDTKFCAVRYGNVIGSRGSVIPFFLDRARSGLAIPITDERMTRFMIRLTQGVGLAVQALETMNGGEVFVGKAPSMNIMDIAEAVDPGGKREIVGIRPGEKLHEQMIAPEESHETREFKKYFVVQNPIVQPGKEFERDGKTVEEGFRYSSDKNSEWMSQAELRSWLHESGLIPTTRSDPQK